MLLEIPLPVSTLILGVLTFVSGVTASLLMRRGKREDNRIASRNQAYDEVFRLAQERLAEIGRLVIAKAAAEAEVERVRLSWEARWDRQMLRCREVTDRLVAVVAVLKTTPNDHLRSDEVEKVNEVLQVTQEHREDDHPEDWHPHPPV